VIERSLEVTRAALHRTPPIASVAMKEGIFRRTWTIPEASPATAPIARATNKGHKQDRRVRGEAEERSRLEKARLDDPDDEDQDDEGPPKRCVVALASSLAPCNF